MRFFFDNCLSPKLARAINCLIEPDHTVLHLRDHKEFSADTPDTKWIQKLGEEGNWVIVSGDLRIKKRREERRVWKESNLTTFFMAKSFVRQKAWDQALWMIRKWPDIQDMASKVAPGASFIVPKVSKKLEQT